MIVAPPDTTSHCTACPVAKAPPRVAATRSSTGSSASATLFWLFPPAIVNPTAGGGGGGGGGDGGGSLVHPREMAREAANTVARGDRTRRGVMGLKGNNEAAVAP